VRRSLTIASATSAVLVAILSACGPTAISSPSPTGGPPGSSPSVALPGPTGSPEASSSPALATLLLKVTSEGGFINPSATLAALPAVAVYTDGRIMTPGPVDAIFPGPLLSPVLVRDVGLQGVSAILVAIKQAGLDRPATGGPGIPGDAGTNVFTVVVDGTTTVTRFAGGGPPGPGAPGGPSSTDSEQAAAIDLLNRLTDPSETWGGPSAPETPFTPSGYRVFVAPGAPPTDASTVQKPVAWPLQPGLDEFGTIATPDRGIGGLRQGVILGDDAKTLAPIFARATAITPFTSGGKSYTLFVRALLPDEIDG